MWPGYDAYRATGRLVHVCVAAPMSSPPSLSPSSRWNMRVMSLLFAVARGEHEGGEEGRWKEERRFDIGERTHAMSTKF